MKSFGVERFNIESSCLGCKPPISLHKYAGLAKSLSALYEPGLNECQVQGSIPEALKFDECQAPSALNGPGLNMGLAQRL
ncbi:hypothetical protein U1Q18_017381 [Sarracenia purpurea var. burkii]